VVAAINLPESAHTADLPGFPALLTGYSPQTPLASGSRVEALARGAGWVSPTRHSGAAGHFLVFKGRLPPVGVR